MVPDALFNAVASTGTLFGDGTPGGIGNPANPTLATNPALAFDEDCANGVLPDVAFIATGASEHPPAIPAAGAQFIAQKLEGLAANDDLWNTTVFVIDYDENDGFFDHVVPPTPDQSEFPEEFVTKASVAGTPGEDLPVGAGFRVPCWVVSPWSVGGKDLLFRLRPHFLPSAHRGRRRRRRAVGDGAAHFPLHQPVASGHLQQPDRFARPRLAAAGAVEHPVQPVDPGGEPCRPAGGFPSAVAALPRQNANHAGAAGLSDDRPGTGARPK